MADSAGLAASDAQIRQALGQRLDACTTRAQKTRLVASVLYYELDLGFPSATTVRQYTQHGSLNDIQRDLRAFLSEIKDRERLQLDLPGFPEAVSVAFTEAAKAVWAAANQAAAAGWDADRAAADAKVQAAEAFAQEELRLRGAAEARTQAALLTVEEERGLRGAAEQRLAALGQEADSLKSALAHAHQQLATAEAARQAELQQFSRDLEAEREARKRDAEMLEGDIRFAKMQIHEAREQNRLLQEQMKANKADREIDVALSRQRILGLEAELSKLRQDNLVQREQVAALRGRLVAGVGKPKASAPGVMRPGKHRRKGG